MVPPGNVSLCASISTSCFRLMGLVGRGKERRGTVRSSTLSSKTDPDRQSRNRQEMPQDPTESISLRSGGLELKFMRRLTRRGSQYLSE